MAGIDLFGWQIKRKEEEPVSFVPKQTDDGATIVAEGGTYGTILDLDGTVRTEAELVNKYREVSLYPEVDEAIDNIVNEVIVQEPETKVVELILDDLEQPENIKKMLLAEFDEILKLLEFQDLSYDVFRRWYVDGRLYYHAILDEQNPKNGIIELRYIDPRKIKKIREIKKKRGATDMPMSQTAKEYYMYNDKGYTKANGSTALPSNSINGLKIAKDSIVHCSSGLMSNNGDMVISYLHKAIKPLNQLKAMEDSLIIYRISRAPERRIFYIDVGGLPKAKAEQYLRDVMTRFKNKVVYDQNTGEVRDDRKFMCYTLDTKIPLLDGRTLTIQEIIDEYNEGKLNWVYSCDPVTGKFYPGPISWAGVTKTESDVVRVTFDNGKSVICTPDHKFPVWDKGFIEAKDLQVGESLIPGYRRQAKVTGNSNLYEQIYKNDTKTWEFTHKEVANWKKDIGINEDMIYKPHDEPFSVVHHVDFNRYNNNPENLVNMGYKDHWKYHTENQTILYSPEMVNRIVELMIERKSQKEILEILNDDLELMSDWRELNSTQSVRLKTFDKLTQKDIRRIAEKYGYPNFIEMRKKYIPSKRNMERSRASKKGSSEWKQKLSVAKINRKDIFAGSKTWKIISPDGNIGIIQNLNEYCRLNDLNRSNIKRDYGSKGYKAEILRNHKVVSVEFLNEKMTVAALTIDQEETYHSHHTYLLDAGVYTKNTMLEDFWLPRREGGRGTEVTTLPGGQNLGQLDDIIYFQKKLFKALNVPVSRLDPEQAFNIGRSTEITRDEVKFGKFINRLRNKFSTLFTKILERQLILKGIITPEEWDLFKNSINYKFAQDNLWAELKETEILRDRIAMLRDIDDYAGKYYSHSWIRRMVLRQSDEDMEEIDEQIVEEQSNPQYSPPQEEPPMQEGPAGNTFPAQPNN